MTDYLTPTAILFHRPSASLNADERAALDSLVACIDEMDGLAATSDAHRWARTARRVEGAAFRAGDLSRADGDLSRAEREWIAVQRRDALNSFQRDRLSAIPGWEW
ncbi:hypothetical protein [Microbacterium sp. NPDC090003]|uniref:hypothetical protein n=1 Tax=Microbacterium sp. NPDC090003 TaxID=3364203 RepID=UPI00382A11E0